MVKIALTIFMTSQKLMAAVGYSLDPVKNRCVKGISRTQDKNKLLTVHILSFSKVFMCSSIIIRD